MQAYSTQSPIEDKLLDLPGEADAAAERHEQRPVQFHRSTLPHRSVNGPGDRKLPITADRYQQQPKAEARRHGCWRHTPIVSVHNYQCPCQARHCVNLVAQDSGDFPAEQIEHDATPNVGRRTY